MKPRYHLSMRKLSDALVIYARRCNAIRQRAGTVASIAADAGLTTKSLRNFLYLEPVRVRRSRLLVPDSIIRRAKRARWVYRNVPSLPQIARQHGVKEFILRMAVLGMTYKNLRRVTRERELRI